MKTMQFDIIISYDDFFKEDLPDVTDCDTTVSTTSTDRSTNTISLYKL